MPYTFPLVSESPTLISSDRLISAVRPGYIGENLRNNSFNPDVPLEHLLGYWCGPGNSYCNRFARALKALPRGKRWAFMGGGFGNVRPGQTPEYIAEHRRLTQLALENYRLACVDWKVKPDGLIFDDEDEWPQKNADDLTEILYKTKIFSKQSTKCVGWYLYDGEGAQSDEWYDGVKPKVGLPDGRTACVHGYLREPWAIGVPLDEQVARIIRQAVGAKALKKQFVPLVTGATHDQIGRPYSAEFIKAYWAMAQGLAALGPAAVWVFACGGQGSPPISSWGLDWPGLGWPNTKPCNGVEVIEESLATIEAWS